MTAESNTTTKIIKDAAIELKDDSSVKAEITISANDVGVAYEEVLAEYTRLAHMKGFRPGKVPRNVLERKYSDVLIQDAMKQLIEKALEEAFDDAKYKPLPYAAPRLDSEPTMELGKDFTFTISYETFPEVELGNYKKLDVEQATVLIGDEDIKRELDALAEQNAIVVPKESGKAENGDVATIDYAEVDDQGNEIVNAKRENFTFTIGSGYNLYKIDDEIIGLAPGEEKTIEKTYPDDYEYKGIAGRTVKLKVKIAGLKQKKLPALDDELAQDISEKYKTLDDLKADIKSKLDQHANLKVRERSVAAMIEKIVKASKFGGLPKTMVERELEVKWRSFLYMYRANEKLILKELEKEGKSKASVLAEWKPKVEEAIKSQIAVEKMIEIENINVTDEEVDSYIRHEAEHQNVDFEEARKQYNANMRENVKFSIQKEKLFDMLLANAKIAKGAKIKYLDFIKENE